MSVSLGNRWSENLGRCWLYQLHGQSPGSSDHWLSLQNGW